MTHPDSPQEREREEFQVFQAWYESVDRREIARLPWKAWQACAAAKDARIEEWERELREALEQSVHWRQLYEAGCATWNPVFQKVLDERNAAQAELAAVRRLLANIRADLSCDCLADYDSQIDTAIDAAPPERRRNEHTRTGITYCRL